ncbi:MAG: TlpA disulfide reductase family protein [Planctomycetota bacterium]|nr:TlpA disulfide reductase family protein [Planctomycetota bacterium]
MKELPVLAAVAREMSKDGLEVLTVSIDTMPVAQLQEFVNRRRIEVPVLLAGDAAGEVKAFLGHSGSLPESYVFDASGEFCESISGAWSKIDLMKTLKKYVGGGSSSGGAQEQGRDPHPDPLPEGEGKTPTEEGKVLLKAYVMGRAGDGISESLLAAARKGGIPPDRILYFDLSKKEDIEHLRELGYEPLEKPGAMICTDMMCAPPCYSVEEVQKAIEELQKP